MNTESIQSKIAGLLAKAESTNFPAEAEALSRKAEQLMVKWGIDEAMLASKRAKSTQAEKIVTEKMEFGSIYSMGLIAFSSSVARGLGLQTLQSKHHSSRHTRYLHIIGHEGDVARAQMLITSLHLQMTTALRVWWSTYELKANMMPAQQVNAKRQFMASFGSAVEQRLVQRRREQEQETQAETTSGPSVALVLRDRKAEVDEFMAARYQNLGRARGMQGSGHGRAEGRAAGQRANLGGTAVRGAGKGALTS
jgi:hypothetical protein